MTGVNIYGLLDMTPNLPGKLSESISRRRADVHGLRENPGGCPPASLSQHPVISTVRANTKSDRKILASFVLWRHHSFTELTVPPIADPGTAVDNMREARMPRGLPGATDADRVRDGRSQKPTRQLPVAASEQLIRVRRSRRQSAWMRASLSKMFRRNHPGHLLPLRSHAGMKGSWEDREQIIASISRRMRDSGARRDVRSVLNRSRSVRGTFPRLPAMHMSPCATNARTISSRVKTKLNLRRTRKSPRWISTFGKSSPPHNDNSNQSAVTHG